MTDAKRLTRERIEAWRNSARHGFPRTLTKQMLEGFEVLCDMALAALRAQQDGVVDEDDYTRGWNAAVEHYAGGQVSRANTEQGSGTTVSPVPPAPDDLVKRLRATELHVVLPAAIEAADRIEDDQREKSALVKLIESSLRQIFPDLCYNDGRPDLWLDAVVTLTKVHRERAERRIAELTEHSIAWRTRAVQAEDRAEKAERLSHELRKSLEMTEAALRERSA